MKKQILTPAFISIGLMMNHLSNAQTYVETFEGFSLPNNSYYKDTTGADWQTTNAVFRYNWDNTYHYWSSGSAYTNMKDTTTGNYTNLYGCIAYNGYNNSNYYTTIQNNAVITLKSPYQIVTGFYITNTTYAAKVMKNGNMFSRPFGDTTGTHCNCPQGSYPDWFKVTIKGYKNGTLLNDSVVFYLADYRFSNNAQDYIVTNWQWVNCSTLGIVDSIQFFMYSSDTGAYGMNTPGFFSIDNFSTSGTAGIKSIAAQETQIFPNPATDYIYINAHNNDTYTIRIYNTIGQILKTENYHIDSHMPATLPVNNLEQGNYILEISNNNGLSEKHLMIKQ